ncbi:TSUP family transporter [Sulfolobus sp. E5-1-F]|uniref:sulfite exporter TauE/SafE family protein n=1 Tax=Sulfolobaceae TaxID=118883 RepID=UPI001295015C|nr:MULTISPECIES: sulfite exporter TauE/SafE family protein [unclassified Sulfolobus]QGA53436.1 TSUP family transporter [Sulfolobus sp. E5-1-F]QGA68885.1 TSUP family transporter [Sulfolobus sp. E11-6]
MFGDTTFQIAVTPLQYLLSIISGILVGFSLGLIGGGGSILAIPLLLYFVGLANGISPNTPEYSYITHLTLGTTALAVGINSYINSYMHFRRGNVRVLEGIVFTIPGVVGDILGAYLSHLMSGALILFLFGFLMIAVAIRMWRSKCNPNRSLLSNDFHRLALRERIKINKVVPVGFLVGFASGYFGIGGGFLVVPGLLFSTGLDMLRAIGTSLIAVGTFGVTAAITYAVYGYVDIIISLLYLVGGVIGGYAGSTIASRTPRQTLRKLFAIIIILVAIYTMYINRVGIIQILHLL